MTLSTLKRRGAGRNGSTDPETIRVAAYCRQSVADDSEFNSVAAQRQAIEMFVECQKTSGWEVLPAHYDDHGFSGGNTERPAFQQLLADVREGKIDVVAVVKVDRMARSVFDLQGMLREFERHGVAFVATTQQINTSGSAGRLVLNLLAAVAEFERDMIRERTRDKVVATRRRGLWTGGVAPIGYDAIEKKLVVNPAEAEQVREVFRLFIELGSHVQVVEELDRRGWMMKVPPKKEMTAPARPFSTTSVKRLLTNPAYAGKVVLAGKEYPGAHEAIVDQATWEKVQHMILDRRGDRRPWRRSKHEALLRGLVRCGACGTAMTVRYTQKGDRKYFYYQCLRILKEGAAACPGSQVPAARLEAAVVDQIKAIGKDPKLLDEVVRAMEHEQAERRPELEARLREVEGERELLERNQRALLSSVADAKAGRKAIVAELGELAVALEAREGEEAALRAELEAVGRQTVDPEGLLRAIEEFDGVWDELFPRERARVLGLLLDGVAFDAPSSEVRLRFGAGVVGNPMPLGNSERP